jgi:hypothetical protein
MKDDTEQFRKEIIASGRVARDLANAKQLWTPADLARDFTVDGFAAPFVIVTRKKDGKKGSLEFMHSPRVYFNWEEDK